MVDLPEYLNDQTYEAILKRMLDRLPSDLDTSEGSFIYDALAPAAAELAQAAIWAQEVLRRGFVQTTFGRYLDLRAAEYGLARKPAVKATGEVVFTGTPGTVIPSGTTISTVASEAAPAVFFVTTAEAVIGSGGTVTADIEAVEPGTKSNVAANTIKLLVNPVTGVTAVTNPAPTSGGLDEENDESLRARLLELVRRDEGDGNVADYIIWAKEVPGVGQVYVEPLWQGPGTVRVVVLDSEGNIPSPALVAAVQEHLDPGQQGTGLGRAPVGAKVTVQAPREVALTVTVPQLQIEPNHDANLVRQNLEAAVRAYVVSVSPGGVVRIKEIEAAIAGADGVLDFGDVLVNGQRQNVELGVDEKAALTAVVYT
jgi:uncharacterized phage protein gp47/JayE